MQQSGLLSLQEVSNNLHISEALIFKFIKRGLVKPVYDEGKYPKLTSYGMRQLSRVLELYEKSHSPESIDYIINH